MDSDLSATVKAVKESPKILDSLLSTLDKYGLLPLWAFREKNLLDAQAIKHKLEEQEREHQSRLALLQTATSVKSRLLENSTTLALDMVQKEIESGVLPEVALHKYDSFTQRAMQSLYMNTVEEQYARERVGLYSLQILAEQGGEIPLESSDTSKTWKSIFWNYAKDVRDEEAFAYWGKLLANEIRRPGSISVKTLDILRTFDSKNAESFSKIAPFILADFIPETDFEFCNVSVYDFNILESFGLFFSGKTINGNGEILVLQNKHYTITCPSAFKIKNLPATGVTPSGIDLVNLHSMTREESLMGAKFFAEKLQNLYGISCVITPRTQ